MEIILALTGIQDPILPFCVAAAGWRGILSRTTALASWDACRLLLGSGGTAWWFVLYGVELCNRINILIQPVVV
jgi:hypothetical protein